MKWIFSFQITLAQMTLVERFTINKTKLHHCICVGTQTTSLIHSSLYSLNQTWKSFRSPPIPTHSASSAPVKWPKALPKAPSAPASYPLLASKPPSTLTPLAVPPSSPSAPSSFLQTTTYYPLSIVSLFITTALRFPFIIFFVCRLFVIVTSSSSRLNLNYVSISLFQCRLWMKVASSFYSWVLLLQWRMLFWNWSRFLLRISFWFLLPLESRWKIFR